MGKDKRKKHDVRRRHKSPPGAGSDTFLTNRPEDGQGLPPDAVTWPIVRALVPVRDVWNATGCGTTAIIRRSPDGRFWSTGIPMQLSTGGIQSFIGGDAKAAEQEVSFDVYADLIPPCEEGSPDLAARYAWGVYAFGLARGLRWPPMVVGRFLNLFPRLGGGRNWWLQQFTITDPLVPGDLQLALARFPSPADLPDGKEVVIATMMTFDVADPAAAAAALRADAENFEPRSDDNGIATFFRIKERRAEPGRKVPFGSVTVAAGERMLVAHGATLSSAAELVDLLRKRIGPGLILRGTKWLDPKRLPFVPAGMVITRGD